MRSPEYSDIPAQSQQASGEKAVSSRPERKKREVKVYGSKYSPKSPFAEIGALVREFRLNEGLPMNQFLQTEEDAPFVMSKTFLGDVELGLKTPSIESVEQLQAMVARNSRNRLAKLIKRRCDEFKEQRKKRKITVTPDVSSKPNFREIGGRIREVRHELGIGLQEMVDLLSAEERVNISTLSMWETGNRSPTPDSLVILQKTLDGLDLHPTVESIRYMILRFVDTSTLEGRVARLKLEEMKQIAEEKSENALVQREESDWLRTVSICDLPTAIKYLRISEGLSGLDFGREVELNSAVLNKYENGAKVPLLFTLNKIIEYAPFQNDGLAAQAMRLKREDKKPVEIGKFTSYTVSEMMEYIRVVKGLTPAEMGKQLCITDKAVLGREGNKVRITDEALTDFIDWMNLSEDSIIRQIMLNRLADACLIYSADWWDGILDEGIVFAEHITALGGYPQLSDRFHMTQDEVKEQLAQEENEADLVNVLEIVRQRSGYNQRDLSLVGGIVQRQYARIIKKEVHPTDVTVAQLFKGAEYPIHHPVTQKALALAEKERKAA